MSAGLEANGRIRDNVARIRERVAQAAARYGRKAEEIRIIAAAKTRSPDMIRAAIEAGIVDIGENYVQEAAGKIDAVTVPARWHLIGHLQRNKAGRAVEIFDVIQTVDNLALAEAIEKRARDRAKVVEVLVEVNVGGEVSKSGLPPARVSALLAELRTKPHLKITGLMAIPPAVPEAAQARPYFASLRRLRDELATGVPGLRELSMGMSDDFEVAIEEGATMVRIGRAIFGPREREA